MFCFVNSPDKSDLHFIIESDGVSGYSLTEGGFAYMKASAKATIGIKNGCYFYECKVLNNICPILKVRAQPHLLLSY